jgi:phage tail-like protein
MARAENSDFLHNFRFQVTDVKAGGGTFLGTSAPRGDRFPQGGFNACGMPNVTVESATYREGIWTYTKKQPGVPTFEPITLSRGVARAETALAKWIYLVIKGGEYRADVTINHFHRDNAQQPARKITLWNAFPTSNKVSSDLDATSSDISITEMTLDYESFDIEVVGGEKVEANA